MSNPWTLSCNRNSCASTSFYALCTPLWSTWTKPLTVSWWWVNNWKLSSIVCTIIVYLMFGIRYPIPVLSRWVVGSMILWKDFALCRNGSMREHLLITGFLVSSLLNLSSPEFYKTMPASINTLSILSPSTSLFSPRTAKIMIFQRLLKTAAMYTVFSLMEPGGTRIWSVWTNRTAKFCTQQFLICGSFQLTPRRSQAKMNHTQLQCTRLPFDEECSPRQDTPPTTS